MILKIRRLPFRINYQCKKSDHPNDYTDDHPDDNSEHHLDKHTDHPDDFTDDNLMTLYNFDPSNLFGTQHYFFIQNVVGPKIILGSRIF